MDFHKIVKKLSKKPGMIVSLDDIARLIEPDYPAGRTTAKREAYALCSRLTGARILTRIRNGLYVVSDDCANRLVDIVDRYYWRIAKKLILNHTGWRYIIARETGIALHLRDYSAPRTLVVYTRDVERTVAIASGYSIRFTTIAGGGKTGRKNLFSALCRYTARLDADGEPIRILSEEAAILDALLDTVEDSERRDYLVPRFLKKYARHLSRARLGELVRLRYITSANRLRALTKSLGHDDLYADCLDIIRDEGGGCYISVS